MNFKSLMLGAAAVATATGVNAADLPVAPEPVDYVRICDAYGARFFYIPGTDTCLRVGGRVRVDYRFTDFASDNGNGWDSKADNSVQFRSRAYMRLDSRTQTEFGLLRTYTDLWFTYTTGGNVADVPVYMWEAFVQLGGFTFGTTGSFFDHWTGTSWGSQLGQGLDSRATVLAYTAAFGNGLSASLSLEDVTYRRAAISGGTYGGQTWPALVANITAEQGWGSAALSAVVKQVRENTSVVDSELGWAIMGDVEFNLPMISSGTTVGIRAAYSDGAVGYVNTKLATDATLVGTNLNTATAWGIAAGFSHDFTPAVNLAVTGVYNSLDAFGTAQDQDQWSLHGTLAWTPVSGLVIGTEVEYVSDDFGAGGVDDDDLTATFRVQRTF